MSTMTTSTRAPRRAPHPGKFVWFEHASGDAHAAQSFFREVLGWSAEPFEGSGYEMILAGDTMDTMIGGYVQLGGGEAGSPRWLAYVSVPDVDAAARTAADSGGRILEGPKDLPGIGRTARIVDPQGAELCLFKHAQGDPEDERAATPPPRRFFWCELHTSDAAGALDFYRKVLGFTHETMDMGPAGAYHVLSRDGVGRGGVRERAARPDEHPGPHWLPYVAVDDPDATARRARELGGAIRVEPEDIPGIGRMAVIEDPTGAVLAVMKARPQSQHQA